MTTTTRKVYRAKHSASCPVCSESIRRGMPIVYVPTRGEFHDYQRQESTVAIHAVCERLHDA